MLKTSFLGLSVFAATMLAADANVERGRYLAEEIAKCQDCHTPRGEKGAFDKTKWMKGATLDIKPIAEIPGWHATAPDLTGSGRLFQRWGEQGLETFLTTGKGPRGGQAGPPMPTYTMNREDAAAIVAYLKSLK